MGKLVYSLLLVWCIPLMVNAQIVKVNIDTKTINQVNLNTAAIETAEIAHNVEVDSIKKKQERLSGLIATLATYKALFHETLENVKGFGQESGIYKAIATNFGNVSKHTASATKALAKTNFTGKAVASFKIIELSKEAYDLGNVFLKIVCNGTVPDPISGKTVEKEKLNLLNRKERLDLALSINRQLAKIDRTLRLVEYYCYNNSFDQILANLDRKTYITYIYGTTSVNQLINRWNGLTN